MITGYLNQTATWKQKTGNNAYGEPVFTEGQIIKVRWEGKRRLVRNIQGKEVVSEASVYCLEPVKTEDILIYADRDWPVITVSEHPGLDGEVFYREVVL